MGGPLQWIPTRRDGHPGKPLDIVVCATSWDHRRAGPGESIIASAM
jgi:hypothetical protein